MIRDEMDPLLDSLLSESLGGERPPDLTSQILERLLKLDTVPMNHWDEAVRSASRSMPNYGASASERRAFPYWYWVSLGTVAASVLVVASSFLFFYSSEKSVHNGGIKSTTPQTIGSEDRSNIKPSTNRLTNDQPTRHVPEREQLPLDSLPLPNNGAKKDTAIPNLQSPLKRERPSTDMIANQKQDAEVSKDFVSNDSPIDEARIVSLINDQFSYLWRRLAVEPQSPTSVSQWTDRVSKLVLGMVSHNSDGSLDAAKESIVERLNYLAQRTQMPEFASYWSKRQTEHWLGSVRREVNSENRDRFEDWLAKRIRDGDSILESQRLVLLATGTDFLGAEDYNPAAYFLIRAGGHSRDDFANQVGRSMFDQDAACARCHDGVESSGRDRRAFWGLVALLQSIQLESINENNRRYQRIVHRPSREAFFQNFDGVLVVAPPRLPDGKQIESSNLSLATSMVEELASFCITSNLAAQEEVDLVWQILLGQPLVPEYGIADDEGQAERRELKSFLAKQFKAHGGDVRKLVSWIGSSEVFALTAPQHDLQNYLLASHSEVQEWRIRDRTFASFGGFDSGATNFDRNKSLITIAKWLKSNHQTRSTILAQSPTSIGPAPANSANSSDSMASQLKFIIQTGQLPASIELNLDRWIQNGLAWNLLADHAFYMTGHTAVTADDREIANQILEYSSDEKRLALRRIIWAELNPSYRLTALLVD